MFINYHSKKSAKYLVLYAISNSFPCIVPLALFSPKILRVPIFAPIFPNWWHPSWRVHIFASIFPHWWPSCSRHPIPSFIVVVWIPTTEESLRFRFRFRIWFWFWCGLHSDEKEDGNTED